MYLCILKRAWLSRISMMALVFFQRLLETQQYEQSHFTPIYMSRIHSLGKTYTPFMSETSHHRPYLSTFQLSRYMLQTTSTTAARNSSDTSYPTMKRAGATISFSISSLYTLLLSTEYSPPVRIQELLLTPSHCITGYENRVFPTPSQESMQHMITHDLEEARVCSISPCHGIKSFFLMKLFIIRLLCL